MNKCKDCKYFKNDCGFASIDKQLGLDGNFVACGHFLKLDNPINIEGDKIINVASKGPCD